MNELIPCPFCDIKKSDVYLDDVGRYGKAVKCDNCGTKGPIIDDYTLSAHESERLAITAWNTRATPQWHPFNSAPLDGTIIEAFHREQKRIVVVSYCANGGPFAPAFKWIEPSRSVSWHHSAFTHWREQSQPPEKTDR